MSTSRTNDDDVVRIASSAHLGQLAASDLVEGLRRPSLWWSLALHDIRQRFRRSALGPLWLTLSMGIMVAALGFVFSQILGQDLQTFLPYLAIGIIFWGFITASINEGCTAFIVAEGFIKGVPIPISVHLYRVLARNMIILGMNLGIYVLVFLAFMRFLNLNFLLVIPGFIVLFVAVSALALIAAILSTRFRDIPQVVANIIQVVFFVTPIFWTIESLPHRPAFIILNPAFHLIEIVRAPLLGQAPSALSWGYSGGLAIVSLALALALYRRVHSRIAFWV